MKKTTSTLIILILLGQLCSVPLLVSEARAETRVTITFAAGGVACGVYFFLQFAFRSAMTIEPFQDNIALINHSPEGWHIATPTLNIMRDEQRNRLSPMDAPEILQMNILKFRF